MAEQNKSTQGINSSPSPINTGIPQHRRCDDPWCGHLAVTSILCDGEPLYLCHKHNAYLNPALPAKPWNKVSLAKMPFGQLLHIYQHLTPSTKHTFGTVTRYTLIDRILTSTSQESK